MGVDWLNCETCNSVHTLGGMVQCSICSEFQFCYDCIERKCYHIYNYKDENKVIILDCCDYCCKEGHEKTLSYQDSIRNEAIKNDEHYKAKYEDYKSKYESLLVEFEKLKKSVQPIKKRSYVKKKNNIT